jgi:hypothetical protein
MAASKSTSRFPRSINDAGASTLDWGDTRLHSGHRWRLARGADAEHTSSIARFGMPSLISLPTRSFIRTGIWSARA